MWVRKCTIGYVIIIHELINGHDVYVYSPAMEKCTQRKEDRSTCETRFKA